MEYVINNPNTRGRVWVTERTECTDVLLADVCFVCDEKYLPESFSVSFSIPAVDVHSVWSSQAEETGVRKLGANWKKKTTNSRLAGGMPLHVVLALDGRNRLTVAASDVRMPISIGTGIREEDSSVECKITFFTKPSSAVSEYKVTLRIDLRDLPFYEVIPQTVAWWEALLGISPMPAPDAALLPMDSLWYSFHQLLEPEAILRQCRASKALGMDTVIIDDGWQTDDAHRGYAYCGDWEPAESKIPDMKGFVDKIHEIGMKVILWYSMPYVGIHSRKYREFEGKYLHFDERRGVGALDPRYTCVRSYLASLYETAVKQWNIDGVKLDFVSAFRLVKDQPDPERDTECLEDAVEWLLGEVRDRLLRIKPDILIEFRQSYVGPIMRQYGNMLRAGDCPNDALCNRASVLDLRLTSGQTPVHSDMVMWNPHEPVERAALQLASVLFSVPQVSVRLENYPPSHIQMLRHYLRFWREKREILMHGSLVLSDPQCFYSKAAACLNGEQIVVLYTDRTVVKQEPLTTVINCGEERQIYFDGFDGMRYEVRDCMGGLTACGTMSELSVVSIPGAGMVSIGGVQSV